MKRFFYIVLSTLLLGAGACTEKILMDGPKDEGTVTLDMSVTIPNLATKAARADNPVIDNIYVAIYGSSHYLNDYVKAFPLDANDQIASTYEPVEGVYKLRVTLQATASKRYVHILANGPSQLDFNTKEDELLNNINTSGTDGAYWSYFVLDHGTAVLNSQGLWEASSDAASKFALIQLVRNFARVEVKSAATDFALVGFHVYRTAAKGSYAMPTDDSGEYYLSTSSYANSATATDAATYIKNTLKYAGHMPVAGDALVDADFLDTDPSASGLTFYRDQYQYVYESPNTTNEWYPYIIIAGKYGTTDPNDSTVPTTYYKIEFSDKDGNRIPLYRNVDYTIKLSAVAKEGESKPEDAETSNGNVSMMATDLSEISDGISAMYVLYTEKTYVIPAKGDEESVDDYNARRTVSFSYQYVQNLNTGTLAQGEISDPEKEGSHAIEFTASTQTSKWYGSQTPNDDNWYEISFKLNPSPDSNSNDLVSSFVVTGTSVTGAKLFRTIKVRVIPVPAMSLTPTVNGNNVAINMNLPTNLPASIFPLIFNVSDSEKCLNPVNSATQGDEMPVVIDETNHSYYFVKTVTRNQYVANQGKVSFTMKRIDAATNSTVVSISNEYFDKDGQPTKTTVDF